MKKIFIFSIMCLFAVCVNAQYNTVTHDWREKMDFSYFMYKDLHGENQLVIYPGSSVLLTYKEDEDVCLVSINLNGSDVMDGSNVFKFYNCEIRYTEDGTVALVDKTRNKEIFMYFKGKNGDYCLATPCVEKLLKSE